MSSLKMYCKSPKPKGLPIPDGFTLTRFTQESDVEDWLWICRDGLIGKDATAEVFWREYGPDFAADPYRDVYFIVDQATGKKIGTFGVVPNMWHSGMGYIHMVAVRHEYRGRGLGKFLADYCLQKLKELGFPCNFLLTGDTRLSALATYLKAGFLPVNYVDDDGADMVDRWKAILRKLKLRELSLLNEDGTLMTTLRSVTVSVTEPPYNAAGDGITNDRAAIQAAIDRVYTAGGGTVVVPGNRTYLTGNLILRTQVELHLEEGAVLQQSSDPADYVKPAGDLEYEPSMPYCGTDKNLYHDIKWAHIWYFLLPLLHAPEGTRYTAVSGGTVRMMDPLPDGSLIRCAPIGLYRTEHFELRDIHITNYHAYAVMPYTCSYGLIQGLTVDNPSGGNGDGIGMMNCQHIRVTGCQLHTEDDALYIFVSYRDPRGNTVPTWWSSDEPQASLDIEIDHNVTTTHHCKGFCMILWGTDCPDWEKIEVRDIYVHDNHFQTLGNWNYNPYTIRPTSNPVTSFRFENNRIDAIEVNFFETPVSNMEGFHAMDHLRNGGFEHGRVYWVMDGGNRIRLESDDTDDLADRSSRYACLTDLDKGNAALYQGLYLRSGEPCCLIARVRTNTEGCRLFVRDQQTRELVASKTISGEAWKWDKLIFTVPKSGNYHLGLERGDARDGWAQLDEMRFHGSCEAAYGFARIGTDNRQPWKQLYFYDPDLWNDETE